MSAPVAIDVTRNRIENGVIHYQLYGQDGVPIAMTMRDTPDLRRFAEWIRIHDRYTAAPE